MTSKKRGQRVELVNKYGAIARPLTKDVQPWLDQGWKRVKATSTEDGEKDNG